MTKHTPDRNFRGRNIAKALQSDNFNAEGVVLQIDGPNAITDPFIKVYSFDDWDTPWVQGPSLNARAIHAPAKPQDAENTLTLPSQTRCDVGARYRTQVAGTPVSASA